MIADRLLWPLEASLLLLPILLATSAGLVAATWVFTTKPVDGSSRWLRINGLLLRGLVIWSVASTFVWYVDASMKSPQLVPLYHTLMWPSALLPVGGFLYLAAVFTEIGALLSARSSRRSAVACVIASGILVLAPPSQAIEVIYGQQAVSVGPSIATFVGGAIFVIVSVTGLVLLRRLQRWMRVIEHEWWLDAEALPDVEWASLARYGNDAVNVLTADGQRFAFDDVEHAEQWLADSGFLHASDASKAGTAAMPPALALGRLTDSQRRRSRRRLLVDRP